MKIRNTITRFFTTTLAVAALAVISYAWTPGRTAGQVALGDGSVRFFSESIDVLPGKAVRITVLKLAGPGDFQNIHAMVLLYDANGAVVARSQEMEVQPGQFRSVDFLHENLRSAGETDTVRLQLRAEIIYRSSNRSEQISPDNLLTSIEIFDTNTGGTILASFFAYPGFSGGVNVAAGDIN